MRHLVTFGTLIAATAVLAGCGDSDRPHTTDSPDPEVATVSQKLGQPEDGFPSYEERAVLYLTNRARTEPDAFNPDDPYPPSAPLRYDVDLAKAARWQAEHIIEENCWCSDHTSCCEMEEAAEGGQCAGPSGSCGGTSAQERVGYWSNNYSGENAAQGQRSAEQALDSWIHSPGHWQNINGGHSLLGPGHYNGGWIQVFGRGGGVPPVAADGIHLRGQSSTTFGITYSQPNTGGPESIMAIVEGQCHELDLAYGEPENGAFETSLSLDAGCHRYYFHITDGGGNEHTYPSHGSLGVEVGDADDCPLYSDRRPADTCSPSGQGCETGHSRPCYTGPYGTADEGICQSGVQRCVGGDWQNECREETLPEPDEVCDNGIDDDCDGDIDEGCAGDSGEDQTPGTSEPGDADEGCTTGAGHPPVELAVALAALIAARRLRSRASSI